MTTTKFKMIPLLGILLSLVFLHGCDSTEEDLTADLNVTTVTASDITSQTAIIEGTVIGENIVSRGVVFNQTGDPTIDDEVKTSGSGEGSFTTEITGLSSSTEYFYKIFATNSNGTTYGTEKSFETLAGLPTVSTDAAAVISFDSVQVTGTVTGTNIDVKGIIIGSIASVDINSGQVFEEASGEGTFDIIIGELSEETTYFAKAYASSGSDIVYGEAIEFTTIAIPLITEIVGTPTVSTTSIEVSANATGLDILSKGFIYADFENVDFENANTTENGEGEGEFTASLDNLIDGTDYYLKSYVTTATDTAYSEEQIVRTESIPLSINEPVISAIQSNSATLTSEAFGSRILDKGFVFGTTTVLDLENGTKLSSGIEGTGVVELMAENLAIFTDYNVVAYVYSDEDTVFSNLTTFKTLADLASVTTLAVSAINETSAASGGEATGNNISQKGVVWATSSKPTLNDSFTEDGAGEGAFTSSLTDLSPKTQYFVRAYVTNDGGTAYGNERSFTTTGNWNVLSIIPANGATGVDALANIEITFDEDINGATVTQENFKLSSTSQPNGIAANISQTDGSGILVINPTDALTTGETYTVFLGTSIESENGNTLANDFTSTFTVFGDNTAPTVQNITPANGEGNVRQQFIDVNITFSEAIDPATINNTNFKVFRGTTELAITVAINAQDAKVVDIDFDDRIFGNAEHEVRIGTGVKDMAGNSIQSAFSSTFTTENFDFNLNNVVSSFENAHRELNENFIIDGTNPLAESNLAAGLISLTRGGVNVPFTPSIVDGNIVINPNNNLIEFDTEYRIQVAAGLKDIYNNVTSRSRDVTFTTIRFSSLYWYSIRPSNTSGDTYIRVTSSSNKSLIVGSITGNRAGHFGFERLESNGRYIINHRLFTNDYLRDTNFDDNNPDSFQLTTLNSPNSNWAFQRRTEVSTIRYSMQNQNGSIGAFLKYDFPELFDAKDNGDPTNVDFWFRIERGPQR